MRSTLFFIPHEIGGWPLFGFGLLLALIAIVAVAWSAWLFLSKQSLSELVGMVPVWLMAAAIVAFVLPSVEQRLPDGTPMGLPIRGYGVMVLIGLLLGIGITVHRGKQVGIAGDTIIGLGFWMMLGGIAGARTFYVVQKWEQFEPLNLSEKFVGIFKLTEGGLVIYGGVIGGLLAGGYYCWRHRLHVLSTADLIVPGFLIGLSIGRIGCLLHGCCFGGVCTAELPAIQFPNSAGAYFSQLQSGKLLGLELSSSQLPARVKSVVAGSPAALQGIQAGQTVEQIQVSLAGNLPAAKTGEQTSDEAEFNDPNALRGDVLVDGQRLTFLPGELQQRSLPVHPSQIYASINALLLCLLIWNLQPVAGRDGVAFCIAVMLYAISRFLLEWVRSDEGGQLGTSLTISQLVAIGSVLIALVALLAVSRLPAGRAWDWDFRAKSA